MRLCFLISTKACMNSSLENIPWRIMKFIRFARPGTDWFDLLRVASWRPWLMFRFHPVRSRDDLANSSRSIIFESSCIVASKSISAICWLKRRPKFPPNARAGRTKIESFIVGGGGLVCLSQTWWFDDSVSETPNICFGTSLAPSLRWGSHSEQLGEPWRIAITRLLNSNCSNIISLTAKKHKSLLTVKFQISWPLKFQASAPQPGRLIEMK